MSNYHLDVKLTMWERYEFDSKEQMLEAKAKLESGELQTTLDVMDTFNLSNEYLLETVEEMDLSENDYQATMEIFNCGEVIWNNAQQD